MTTFFTDLANRFYLWRTTSSYLFSDTFLHKNSAQIVDLAKKCFKEQPISHSALLEREVQLVHTYFDNKRNGLDEATSFSRAADFLSALDILEPQAVKVRSEEFQTFYDICVGAPYNIKQEEASQLAAELVNLNAKLMPKAFEDPKRYMSTVAERMIPAYQQIKEKFVAVDLEEKDFMKIAAFFMFQNKSKPPNVDQIPALIEDLSAWYNVMPSSNPFEELKNAILCSVTAKKKVENYQNYAADLRTLFNLCPIYVNAGETVGNQLGTALTLLALKETIPLPNLATKEGLNELNYFLDLVTKYLPTQRDLQFTVAAKLASLNPDAVNSSEIEGDNHKKMAEQLCTIFNNLVEDFKTPAKALDRAVQLLPVAGQYPQYEPKKLAQDFKVCTNLCRGFWGNEGLQSKASFQLFDLVSSRLKKREKANLDNLFNTFKTNYETLTGKGVEEEESIYLARQMADMRPEQVDDLIKAFNDNKENFSNLHEAADFAAALVALQEQGAATKPPQKALTRDDLVGAARQQAQKTVEAGLEKGAEIAKNVRTRLAGLGGWLGGSTGGSAVSPIISALTPEPQPFKGSDTFLKLYRACDEKFPNLTRQEKLAAAAKLVPLMGPDSDPAKLVKDLSDIYFKVTLEDRFVGQDPLLQLDAAFELLLLKGQVFSPNVDDLLQDLCSFYATLDSNPKTRVKEAAQLVLLKWKTSVGGADNTKVRNQMVNDLLLFRGQNDQALPKNADILLLQLKLDGSSPFEANEAERKALFTDLVTCYGLFEKRWDNNAEQSLDFAFQLASLLPSAKFEGVEDGEVKLFTEREALAGKLIEAYNICQQHPQFQGMSRRELLTIAGKLLSVPGRQDEFFPMYMATKKKVQDESLAADIALGAISLANQKNGPGKVANQLITNFSQLQQKLPRLSRNELLLAATELTNLALKDSRLNADNLRDKLTAYDNIQADIDEALTLVAMESKITVEIKKQPKELLKDFRTTCNTLETKTDLTPRRRRKAAGDLLALHLKYPKEDLATLTSLTIAQYNQLKDGRNLPKSLRFPLALHVQNIMVQSRGVGKSLDVAVVTQEILISFRALKAKGVQATDSVILESAAKEVLSNALIRRSP